MKTSKGGKDEIQFKLAYETWGQPRRRNVKRVVRPSNFAKCASACKSILASSRETLRGPVYTTGAVVREVRAALREAK